MICIPIGSPSEERPAGCGDDRLQPKIARLAVFRQLRIDDRESKIERPSRSKPADLGGLDRLLVAEPGSGQRGAIAVVGSGEYVENASGVGNGGRQRARNTGLVAGRPGMR